ncbi:MAG TPA: cyclic dehypoxanthinyl futalosine synthase [Bacteroidales bacterium]|nr:cyclic dehypoxanthinyl futalosine synthase [Bacteroidales bacterium]
MTDSGIEKILRKAVNLEFISHDEGLLLYNKASLSDLMYYSSLVRQIIHPEKIVTYIVDRNINLTNICCSKCLFCNFCRAKNDNDAYILTIDDYRKKIDELFNVGGNQILLQGGMNPDLDIFYYENLFKELKYIYPTLKLHALGPPEVVFIAKKSKISCKETLIRLRNAGLDSLPGAGAEILSDRVRKIVSPAKCSSEEWLNVMRTAHKLGITTSSTMMFGHLETIEERIDHIIKIRDLQSQKPQNTKGFISFTLWPLAGKNTRLIKKFSEIKQITAHEYLRMLSISRLLLINVQNIQVSWLTMGEDIAQLCLNAGANDMSSIMIEENVVSQAGKNYKMGSTEMEQLILKAGFKPIRRNQEYKTLKEL